MKNVYFSLISILIGFSASAQLNVVTSYNQVIRDLIVYDGDLHIGGNFTENEGNTCYWSSYYNGSTITRHTTLIGGNGIREFAVFDNDLYNVGAMQFGSSIGVGVWTGSGWDNGGSTNNSHSTIYADNTELYVVSDQGLVRSKTAGDFFSTFYDFGSSSVSAIERFGNDLVFGGTFTEVNSVSANRIAKWDGSTWSALGSGLDGFVSCMEVYNNELYVAGDFTMAGGVSVSHIAKWDGSSWSDVDGGMTGSSGFIHDMVVHDGKLYVCGQFGEIGGSTSDNFAYWDGTSWTGINYPHPESMFRSIAVYNNEIYLGGWDFDESNLYRYEGGLDVSEYSMESNVSLHPNPAQNNLNISGLIEGENKIQIISMTGAVVLERTTHQVGSINIDLHGVETGIYYVTVENNGEVSTKKLIIN